MSTSTPYVNIPVNQYVPIFKAGSEDIVLTVEFKNLNQNRVKLQAELVDQNGKELGLSINAEIPENKSYKKFNVLVKAGKSLMVSTSQPGFAARAYKPALYVKPGQIYVSNNTSTTVSVNLDADGVHTVTARGLPQGVSISPASAEVRQGGPATFTLTRDGISKVVGAVFFQISSLGIGTAADVLVDAPPPDDGNSGGNGDDDPDINADLLSAYVFGRDVVAPNN